MVNYFALFMLSVIGIVVFDEDPSSVSVQEWILFPIMIYSAIAFFRAYLKRMSEENK